VDWNDDGLEDIIVGDRNGYISYFRRTGSGVNDLTSEGKIAAGGTAINVGSNSAPACVYVHHDGSRERLDWNEDGKCDMLVGLQGSYPSGSNLRIYLNQGTNASPVFTGYENIPGTYGYRFCPQVVDLDGDGKKDVVAGNNDANIVFYQNTGTNEAPVLAAGVNLQSNGTAIDLYSGTRLWVDDWNSDGILDLLVSDYNGYVYKFLGQETGVGDFHYAGVNSGFAVNPVSNPASGMFAVNLQGVWGSTAIRVYDASGRQVAETVAQDDAVIIDAAGLPSGVYSIAARNGDCVSTCRVILTD
jgi:hypothetical protein